MTSQQQPLHTEDPMEEEDNKCNKQQLNDWQIRKEDNIVAVTTPIPDREGKVSKKTPIFHLPVYRLDLKTTSEPKAIEQSYTFHCDLADVTDLIGKLKSCENMWRRWHP